MTHAELCERAGLWLRDRRRCVAVTTRRLMTREQPDALGWTASGHSTLVECKASRSDFLKDAHKPFRRRPDLGMGQERFFLAPKGLIGFEEVPDGWGLLEVRGKTVKVVRQSKNWKADTARERAYLAALVRYGREAWELTADPLPSPYSFG